MRGRSTFSPSSPLPFLERMSQGFSLPPSALAIMCARELFSDVIGSCVMMQRGSFITPPSSHRAPASQVVTEMYDHPGTKPKKRLHVRVGVGFSLRIYRGRDTFRIQRRSLGSRRLDRPISAVRVHQVFNNSDVRVRFLELSNIC